MFINFEALETASDLIPVLDMEKILSRKMTAVRDFIAENRLKKVQKGTQRFIVKKDLLHCLDKHHWLPNGYLETNA